MRVGKPTRSETGRTRRGFTLVEVLVSIILVTVGLLGASKLAAMAMRTSFRSRDEARYWADVQEVTDSLMARGFNNSTSVGSWQTIRGRQIKWTVTTNTTAPETLTVVVQRPGYVNQTSTANDTVVVFLAKMNPGP